MPVIRRRLYVDQGADYARTWLWETGAVGAVSPVNLTGATATFQVTSPTVPGTPVVSVSTTPNGQGSIVLGGSAGTIALAIDNATTAGLATGVYLAKLFITWANGTIQEFLSGPFIVSGS
jgi:hypothetical protein